MSTTLLPQLPVIHGLFSPDAKTRLVAARQLRELGGTALPHLSEVALGQVAPLPVKRVTGFLGRGPDPRELKLEARRIALELLAHLDEPQAGEVFAAVLQQETDDLLRAQAAIALAARQDPRAVPHLLLALHCRDMNLRGDAAEALGRLKVADAVEPLLQMMQTDGQPVPRWKAAQALGQIGDRRAVPALIKVLQALLALPAADWAPPDPAGMGENRQLIWAACQAAMEALTQIGDPRALPILEQLAREAPARSIGSKAWHLAQTLRGAPAP